ncbi:MAG: adenylosuccinate lyase [Candidatus Odinarchaeota archaeon]
MTSFAYERYRTGIADLFTEEKKLEFQLQVERELAYANYRTGKIPEEACKEIARYSTPEHVKLVRVKEIEEETHHDLMSVVLAISEQCPEHGGYVHLGATSNDVQDTVLGMQLHQAKIILLDHLNAVSKELMRLARKYRDLVCIGRTHGQHAVPITYGFKFANFLSEVELAKQALQQATVNYGKMSGAVGNYASQGTRAIERIVLERLQLQQLPITTQVIPRIIHSRFIFALSAVAATLERLAKEIRNLQRSEIAEMFEKFGTKQVGSSTMPQKRNPHKSERVCGIAKYLRGMAGIELENIPLEHERDITNSSAERFIIPETVMLTDYIILEMVKILQGLTIDEKKVNENLHLSRGRVCAERLMIALADKIGRQQAHELLNRLASIEGDYIKAVKNSPVKEHLTADEITILLDSETYTGLSKEIVDQVLQIYGPPKTYAEAGVDINKEISDIKAIGQWVAKTFEFGDVGAGFGHYVNTIGLDDWELGLATDGVGSKLMVADMVGKYDTIGIDCVAMNVNDLLCLGMKPVAFVDYLATEKSLGPEKAGAIAKGLYEGCKQASIPILGGEMATLPEMITGFDLAGTALGIAKKGTLVDGTAIKPRDVIIGMASNGIHSNGFTLARKVLLSSRGINDRLSNGKTIGEELLRPTRIYCREVLALMDELEVKGIAHITGSGFRKMMRLTGYGFRIDYLPELPLIFREIKEQGNISWDEMFSTFNMGIGMVVVVSPKHEDRVLEILSQFGDTWKIGQIIEEKKVIVNPYSVTLDKKEE